MTVKRALRMPQHLILRGPLSYSECGSGKAVVLLHAFPLDGRMWAPQVEAFKVSHRMIAPDYPGFGRSFPPPAQPDMRYYAEQIGELLDRLNLEDVIVWGLSMG